MDNDIPFFMNTIHNPDEKSENYIWTVTLLGGVFKGTVVWCQQDVNAIPIMLSVEQESGKIVEIPWSAIQCITYEGKKDA